MRFVRLHAVAFGPLKDEQLEFGPGMNVLVGANESGKSSWHTALYAGLCGRRRGRGRATKADVAFEEQHKPWDGGAWEVRCVIDMDDGRTIDLGHELADRVDCRAVDMATGEDLTSRIQFEGSADGSRFLGLNRNIMLSTSFVGQADLLAVLEDPGQLQEHLQRAASAGPGDATAWRALAALETYLKDEVGTDRAPAKPLRATQSRLERAKTELTSARERHSEYVGQVDRHNRKRDEAAALEKRLADLEAGALAARLAELDDRLGKIRGLAPEFEDRQPPEPAARDHDLEAASKAVDLWERRSQEPPPLSGLQAADLEAEMAALPCPPEGDIEPCPEVEEAYIRMRDFQRDVERGRASMIEEVEIPASGTSPSELRDLASEIERAGTTSASRRLGRRSLVSGSLGAVVAVVGAVLLSTGLDALGVVLLTLGGLTVIGTAILVFIRREIAAAGVGKPDIARTRRRLSALSLVEDPAEIRRIAIRLERAEGMDAEQQQRSARLREMELDAEVSRDELVRLLESRGLGVDPGAVDASYRQYVEECRWRRSQAEQSARRANLEDQLRDRRELELAHRRTLEEIAETDQAVRDCAVDLGLGELSAQDAAAAVQAWLKRERGVHQDALDAWTRYQRFSGLLEEKSINDWERERADVAQRLSALRGDAPVEVSSVSEKEMGEIRTEHQQRQKEADELSGGIKRLGEGLPDLASLEEEVGREEAELARLTDLLDILKRTIEFLTGAEETVHRSIAPRLKDAIERRLPDITGGRYHEVTVNPEDLTVKVRATGGSWQPATVLSHGTSEQIYLLLRVALAEHLVTSQESAPLVLDDVTVQSDAERTIAVLELLHELSKERQVILFSQEQEVVDWAEANLVDDDDRHIHLEPL